MAYTETTSRNWFSRLGASFRGVLVGIVLLVAGTALLWWNEGDFVATGDALREAQAVTRELGNISKPDASNNGQLVHASGPAATRDILEDPVFGLSVNAIRLTRTVEFFQWVQEEHTETKKKMGGGEETVTTYTYTRKWTGSPVDSSAFKSPDAQRNNRNFALANMENLTAQAANVSFGAYRLPQFMINSISGAIPLNVTIPEAKLHALNKQAIDAARESGKGLQQSGDHAAREAAVEDTRRMVHISGNTVLFSRSPGVTEIGDVRITFKETRPDTVSILGKVNGDTFEQYLASNGKTVGMLVMGTLSLETMYGDAHSENAVITWILRLAGTLLVIIGLKMMAAPLQVLASVIPLLGDIVGAGTGIASVVLGLAWSLVIVSIAWLRFRPVIGIGILAVAGVLVGLLYFRGHSRKAAKACA